MENKKTLKIPFADIYPLTSESVSIILDHLGETDRVLVNLKEDLWSFGNVIILNREKAVKVPTIKDIMTTARSDGVIVVPDCSSACYTAVNDFNEKYHTSFSIMKIISFVAAKYRDTIPISMGCNANKSLGDNTKPKKSITIRVPLGGFPGYKGNLNASDIYKIIDSKTNDFEAKGFDIVMTAFEKMSTILNKGKNITPTQWNSILTETGVYAHLESAE